MTNQHQLKSLANESNNSEKAAALLKQADLYFRCEEYQRALSNALRALEINHPYNEPAQHIAILIQIGLALTHQNQFDEGLTYFEQAINLAHTQGLNRLRLMAFVYMGEGYLRQDDYEAVLETQNETLKLAQSVDDSLLLARAYKSLGAAKIHLGAYDEAKVHLEYAFELADEGNDSFLLAQIYHNLARLYEAVGSFEQALDYYKQYHLTQETARRESKRQLIAHLEADIVHLREVELAAMRGALKNGQREQEQFMKIVAHELQNPLTSMTMNASMLQSYFDQLTPEKAKERIERIANTAQAMNQIVENMLNLRMLKQGQAALAIEPVDADQILDRAVENYHELATAKSISLHYTAADDTCRVMADQTALKQIIDNLVSNAIKYTPPDRQVFVSAVCNRDWVQFIVQDEGQGLTDEDMQGIFKEFNTLSARPTGGERSTGLGLAIVKMMVEAMHGRVWATSDGRDQGSTFTVELPTAH